MLAMPTRPTLVVDKSFLQGVSTAQIRSLCTTHRLVMTDVLFYELMTCQDSERIACFWRFPPEENPVILAKHVGAMLKHEIESHRPFGLPSKNPEDIRFRFNPALTGNDYVLPDDAAAAIEEENSRTHKDVLSFIERVHTLRTMFPDLLKGSDTMRGEARTEAERVICTDPEPVLDFYSSLEPPEGQPSLPPATIVSPSWALFRWLQVQLLIGLDAFIRYGGLIPDQLSMKAYEKLEHDVLDAQYLITATLEGSFATRETKLKRFWQMLRPDGVLMS